MDVYYAAYRRAAAVRTEAGPAARTNHQRIDAEMVDALGDAPSEMLSYLFRRGYAAGWKQQVAFAGTWDVCRATLGGADGEG
jgi:hypothetical protein